MPHRTSLHPLANFTARNPSTPRAASRPKFLSELSLSRFGLISIPGEFLAARFLGKSIARPGDLFLESRRIAC
jgi:hypothetical protein